MRIGPISAYNLMRVSTKIQLLCALGFEGIFGGAFSFLMEEKNKRDNNSEQKTDRQDDAEHPKG